MNIRCSVRTSLLSVYFKQPLWFFIFVGLLILSSSLRSEDKLEYQGPSPGSGDQVYPTTPFGRQIKNHLSAMTGVGEDAEAFYQKSLAAIRSNPEVISTLVMVYSAIPERDYFRRTLVVETLKEIRNEAALPHLARIANTPIPKDTLPKNAEVNTREDEIIVRITAVQGISILAEQGLQEADDILLTLINNEDLTVRQMAARGYLRSSSGNAKERREKLLQIVPAAEHWYLTPRPTDIRNVEHPEVLPDFDLEEFSNRKSDEAPSTR